jgi:GNAT superfamily N-acetyltransferase
MPTIRPCRDDERDTILQIVNQAASAYRGVIPGDRWREPYMSAAELDREITAGVRFWGSEADGELVGDVDLIRHSYVRPDRQRCGIGGALLRAILDLCHRRLLVGTWAAADWAIRFYERHGFELVAPEEVPSLLRAYWAIPDRQIEASVVLEHRRAGSPGYPTR